MKRQDKYPNTETFTFHNENPKNKFTTDCVVRTIATATEQPYSQVLQDLCEIQIKTGLDMSEPRCYGKYLESKGFKKNNQPKHEDGTKYTGKEFCKEIQTHRHWYSSHIVAHIGTGHVVAIMYGKVHDTWDSTNGAVGVYWEK